MLSILIRVYFLSTTNESPLLVSLHHWSREFTTKDSLSNLAFMNNWNYISPNFRGTNYNEESCLSSLVISDIDDAIEYAIENSKVDTNNYL